MAIRRKFFSDILRTHSRLALLVFLALPIIASAFDEYPYDRQLVKELAEIGMTGYASLQVQNMYDKYPGRTNEIRFLQSEVYMATNEYGRAIEILTEVSPASPLFAESRLLLGEINFRRGEFEKAEQVFRDLFRVQPAPLSPKRDDVMDYIEAVQMYAQVFIQLGRPRELGTALDHLAAVSDTVNITRDEITYLKAQAALAAYDLMEEDPEQELDTGHVREILSSLERIQITSDYMIVINATLEAAHAHVLLGEPIPAIRKIRTLENLLNKVQDSPNIPPESSPIATAYFYEGRALKALAERAFRKEGDRDKAKKLLLAASKRFKRITKDYNTHRLNEPSMFELGKIQALLEKEWGIPPDTPGYNPSLVQKLRQADRLYGLQEYREAAPLYRDILRMSRMSGRVPEIGLRLSYCYAQAGDYLRSEAIASYMADLFPGYKQTAEAYLQLGNFIYNSAQKMDDGPEKEETLDRAMEVWGRFVALGAELEPPHPTASDRAYIIAENQYRKANQVARQARQASNTKEREDLKEKARSLFEAAIPLYEHLISKFDTTTEGVRGYYKLGWVYHALEDKDRAAENFLRYYNLETNPDNARDRMLAKFHAAHQLMSSDDPLRAVEHFQEFIEAIQNADIAGLDTDAEEVQNLLVDAESYLGWTYDLGAEAVRAKLTEIDERIAKLEANIAEQTNFVSREQQKKEEAAASIAQAEETLAARTSEITSYQTPEKAAQAALQEQLEDAGTDEERARIRRTFPMDDFTRNNRQQLLDNLAGQRQEMDAERKAAHQRYLDLQRELENTRDEIAEIEEELENARNEYNEADQELTRRQQEINALKNKIKVTEAAADEWQKKIAAAEKAGRAATKAGDRDTARQYYKEWTDAKKQLADATVSLNEARQALAEVQTEELQKQMKALEVSRDELAKQIDQKEARLSELQQAENLLAKQIEIENQKKKALARQIEYFENFEQLVKVPQAERDQFARDNAIEEKLRAAIQGIEELKNAKIAREEAIATAAEADIREAKQDIANARKAIKVQADRRAPIRARFEDLKTNAQEQFIAFNKQYPKSTHVPSNLARLGTNYMELGDYEKAQKYLTQLKQDYPDKKAVLEKAMFSLAKAQFETGREAEAVETFQQILKDKREQSVGSLSYIMKEMLENDYPKLALSAIEELLRRSEDPSHEDHERLKDKTRETLLFRAGSASFQAENYQQAIDYIESLLEINENTAHFFNASLILGKAQRQNAPPNLQASREAFLNVIKYVEDPVAKNEAIIEAAKTFLAMADEKSTRQALAQLGQLVIVAGNEVIVLADQENEANAPLLEEAIYLAAKGNAILGNAAERDMLVDAYREMFPGGRFAEDLRNLPAAKFAPEPAVGAATE